MPSFLQDIKNLGNEYKEQGLNTFERAKGIVGIKPESPKYKPANDNVITKAISKFYAEKSISHSYNFIVDFSQMPTFVHREIESFYVKSVSIPNHNFEIKSVMYGSVPKSYTIMAKDRPLQIGINFEDDLNLSVLKLAYELQTTIIDNEGFYRPLDTRNLGNLTVVMFSTQGLPVFKWECLNLFYLGFSDTIQLAYENSESVKVEMKFGCNAIKYVGYDYTKKYTITPQPKADEKKGINTNKLDPRDVRSSII